MLRKLEGGWRKETFLDVENKIVVSWVDKDKISREKFEKSIRLEIEAGEKGFLVRKFFDKGEDKEKYWVKWHYLEGEVRWIWKKNETDKIAELLVRLYKKNIIHGDIKPGNILWNDGGDIVGIIDFEEGGEKDQKEDLSNTLSWVMVSGGDKKSFLETYIKNGGKFDDAQIGESLLKCLHMRANEGNNQALIMLAKERLGEYQSEVKGKSYELSELSGVREKYKKNKIIFTVGSFDLLHWGHFDYLKKIKKEGDLLIVGVASDESIRRLKGEGFPLVGDKTRMETLCFFGNTIDGVVIVDEDNVMPVLEVLKPDVFSTTKKDWDEGLRKEKEEEFVLSYGGKVVKETEFALKMSSSGIMKQAALAKVKQVLLGEVRRQPMLKIKKKNAIAKEVKLIGLEDLGNKIRKQNKTVTFVSLSADLFHLGHARFIQKAKSLSDILVVGLPSNESLTALKGPGRPIVDETSRALVLSELKYVDHVVIFDERTILGCLQRLKPNFFFTVKEDWNSGFATSPEALYMQSIGGKVVRSELQAPFISASKIINKAAGDLIKRKFEDLLKLSNEISVLNADLDPFSPEAQLTAREKSFYDKIWQEVANKQCVFCELNEKYIIAEKDGVVLTVCLFPYIDGHLLIVPRRHIESIQDLNEKEEKAIFELKTLGVNLLREKMGIENCWILVREGDGIKAGKTVLHLHYHVLPYDIRVVKMGETKLNVAPIDIVKKLKTKTSNKDEFLRKAAKVALGSGCLRGKRGSVFVKDGKVLGQAFNTCLPANDICQKNGCMRDKLGLERGKDLEKCRSIHSEALVVCESSKRGVSLNGSTAYITCMPCVNCAKLMLNAGVKEVFYLDIYGDNAGEILLQKMGVKCERIKLDNDSPEERLRDTEGQ